MNPILQYLKTHGESSDADIAKAVGLTLANARIQLTELTAKGDIMSYQSTKFEGGKKIEGMTCLDSSCHSYLGNGLGSSGLSAQ